MVSMISDPDNIIQIPPSNYKVGRTLGAVSYKPEAIIIHLADGSYNGTISWFKNPLANVSSHYLIGKDGAVVNFVDEKDTAFHAGAIHQPTWRGLSTHLGINPNYWTVGIEHAGKPHDIWSEAQYKASIQLISQIAKRWSIPIDADHIVRHSTINALHGQCPGTNCDMDRLIKSAAKL